MTIIIKNKQTLFFDEFIFKCCIGKKGFTKNKMEGDKKTPSGIYYLENLYYRKDRVKKPETSLNKSQKRVLDFIKNLEIPKSYNGKFNFNSYGYNKYYDTNVKVTEITNDFIFSSNRFLNSKGVASKYNIFLKNSSGTSTAIFAPIIEPSIAENANQIDNL